MLSHWRRDGRRAVRPLHRLDDGESEITARTAIVTPVFDEDPQRVFAHLRAVEASLERTGWAHAFEIFVLSDTRVPEIREEEERRFEAWRQASPHPGRLHYRRRLDNVRHKVGNIEDRKSTRLNSSH